MKQLATASACIAITGITPATALAQAETQAEQQLKELKERTNALERSVESLEATVFAPTTKLHGTVNLVLGANAFGGSWGQQVDKSRRRFGGTTLNYDMKLILDTSFTGQDLLRLRLRSGNFDKTSNSFSGAGPTVLSQLEVAFQEPAGPNRLGVNRLFYQFPAGDFRFTLGALVELDDILAINPSRYPYATVLDMMTFGGAIGASNMKLGSGLGASWQKNGFAITASYISGNAKNGNPSQGGLGNPNSDASASVQIGYNAEQWSLIGIYTVLQNGFRAIPYGTPLALSSLAVPGTTHAYGISANWEPRSSGWLPLISAGWGINQTNYNSSKGTPGKVDPTALVQTSQSWSVGLRWSDVLAKGNAAGFAFGQPVFATRLQNGKAAHDGNTVWEFWYQYRVSDAIQVTPGLFYLSRPFGQATAQGRSFDQLGALIKTTFRF